MLDDALGGSGGVDSGVLDIKLDVESTGGDSGELAAELQGPFRSNGTGELPSVDFDVDASVGAGDSNLDFEGGLTMTDAGAWVGFQGTEYQLDDTTFAAVKTAYERSAAQRDNQEQGSLAQFGVDPRNWVSGLTNEGTEDLDGAEVVHISGTADVPKLVADLDDVARQSGGASALGAADLSALKRSVTGATVDVYATSDDHSLRKIDVGLTLADPGGGPGEVDVELSIGISDPGSDQDISAPEDARPLAELLGRIPGGAQAFGVGAAPDGASPPAAAPEASGAAEDYYDCVAKAKGASAVEDCAGLLGG